MAYAVANLVEILEQDQHHLNLNTKPQIDFFLDKARSFMDFLINYFPLHRDLERRIVDAAHMAEDVIEIHIMNQILQEEEEEEVSQLDVTDLVKEFEFIKEEMMLDIVDDTVVQHRRSVDNSPPRTLDIVDDTEVQHRPSVDNSPPHFPSLPNRNRKYDDVAIFEDDFLTLKERLIEGPTQLQIIPIHGMPGMGKRTLARRLYRDSLVANHFETRILVNGYSELGVEFHLLNLLEALGKLTDEMHQQNANQLGAHLRNALKKRKYLIVLYDFLYENIWVELRRFFPNDNVGGRIILTIWGWDEVTISTCGEAHFMPFLTHSESWLLLCRKVFGQEHCPDELEPFGETIIELCKGIPLAIACIAGLLATADKIPSVWEIVATKLTSILETEEVIFINSSVIKFVFVNLPDDLKPCILYIGVTYECHDIRASKIIKQWIAEGFIEQTADNSPEDIAEACMEILVEKNLLSVTREKPNGKVKAIEVQPLFAMFYWIRAYQVNFSVLDHFSMLNSDSDPEDENSFRRVHARPQFLSFNEIELTPLTRSLRLASGRASLRLASMFQECRLLRVLDVFQLEFYQFPEKLLQLVFLRYLALSCHSNLPTEISKFRNLQTLIIRRLPSFRSFSLPSELWELTQLRHIECKETFIWYYPENGKKVQHVKLQSLSNMQLVGVTNEFWGKIPNIRKLGIFCNIAMNTALDLDLLYNLENLKCSSDWSLASHSFLSYLKFPIFLRKLTLSLCRIPWGFMKVVGSLPYLKQLKLQKSDFLFIDSGATEPEWEPVEGEFTQLLSLVMEDLNMVHWRAHATHFPKLRQLVIQNCYAMVEIPLDIGDIQTLELIQVDKTSPFVLASAMRIKNKCEGRGNKFLQVRTTR